MKLTNTGIEYTKEELEKILTEARQKTTQMWADLASVQPMPDNIDWLALERAYSAIASHLEAQGIEPLLKVRKPDESGRSD